MKIIDDILKTKKTSVKPITPTIAVGDEQIQSQQPKAVEPPSSIQQGGSQSTNIDDIQSHQQEITTTNTPQSAISSTPQQNEPNVKILDKVSSYQDMLKMLEGKGKERTEEEIKKEEKRERRKALIAAIGDGVGSLANLYFTSKGAQSIDMPSLSKINNERHQKMIDERKANQEKYKAMYMNAFGNDMRLTEQRNTTKQAEMNRQRAEQKEERRYQQNFNYRKEQDNKQTTKDERLYNLRMNQYNDEKFLNDKKFNHQVLKDKGIEARAMDASSLKKDKNTFSITYTDLNSKKEKVLHIDKKNEGAIVSLYSDIVKEAAKRNEKMPSVADLKLSMGEGGDQKGKMLSIILGRLKDFPELNDKLFSLVKQPNDIQKDSEVKQTMRPINPQKKKIDLDSFKEE